MTRRSADAEFKLPIYFEEMHALTESSIKRASDMDDMVANPTPRAGRAMPQLNDATALRENAIRAYQRNTTLNVATTTRDPTRLAPVPRGSTARKTYLGINREGNQRNAIMQHFRRALEEEVVAMERTGQTGNQLFESIAQISRRGRGTAARELLLDVPRRTEVLSMVQRMENLRHDVDDDGRYVEIRKLGDWIAFHLTSFLMVALNSDAFRSRVLETVRDQNVGIVRTIIRLNMINPHFNLIASKDQFKKYAGSLASTSCPNTLEFVFLTTVTQELAKGTSFTLYTQMVKTEDTEFENHIAPQFMEIGGGWALEPDASKNMAAISLAWIGGTPVSSKSKKHTIALTNLRLRVAEAPRIDNDDLAKLKRTRVGLDTMFERIRGLATKALGQDLMPSEPGNTGNLFSATDEQIRAKLKYSQFAYSDLANPDQFQDYLPLPVWIRSIFSGEAFDNNELAQRLGLTQRDQEYMFEGSSVRFSGNLKRVFAFLQTREWTREGHMKTENQVIMAIVLQLAISLHLYEHKDDFVFTVRKEFEPSPWTFLLQMTAGFPAAPRVSSLKASFVDQYQRFDDYVMNQCKAYAEHVSDGALVKRIDMLRVSTWMMSDEAEIMPPHEVINWIRDKWTNIAERITRRGNIKTHTDREDPRGIGAGGSRFAGQSDSSRPGGLWNEQADLEPQQYTSINALARLVVSAETTNVIEAFERGLAARLTMYVMREAECMAAIESYCQLLTDATNAPRNDVISVDWGIVLYTRNFVRDFYAIWNANLVVEAHANRAGVAQPAYNLTFDQPNPGALRIRHQKNDDVWTQLKRVFSTFMGFFVTMALACPPRLQIFANGHLNPVWSMYLAYCIQDVHGAPADAQFPTDNDKNKIYLAGCLMMALILSAKVPELRANTEKMIMVPGHTLDIPVQQEYLHSYKQIHDSMITDRTTLNGQINAVVAVIRDKVARQSDATTRSILGIYQFLVAINFEE